VFTGGGAGAATGGAVVGVPVRGRRNSLPAAMYCTKINGLLAICPSKASVDRDAYYYCHIRRTFDQTSQVGVCSATVVLRESLHELGVTGF